MSVWTCHHGINVTGIWLGEIEWVGGRESTRLGAHERPEKRTRSFYGYIDDNVTFSAQENRVIDGTRIKTAPASKRLKLETLGWCHSIWHGENYSIGLSE